MRAGDACDGARGAQGNGAINRRIEDRKGAIMNKKAGHTDTKRGLLICGHGSRNRLAIEEFARLAHGIKARFGDWPVTHGYLEFAKPVIGESLEMLRMKGCTEILAVPGMLFAAAHVKNDLPSVLNSFQSRHPGVQIRFGRELGIDPRMIRAASARIEEALARAPRQIAREDTLLMLVGRGASDPDANSSVAKLTRMLWEGMGFGWAETAYSGVTFPLVGPGLVLAARLGFARILVMPWFLFTGVLVQRIYRAVDEAAKQFPDIDFVKAGYLSDHPLVLDTMAARVSEIDEGTNVMNCQMCKYREQIPGFEAETGLAQESHHHHVEGLGDAAICRLCDGECTGACEGIPAGHHHHHPHGDVHSHGRADGRADDTSVPGHTHRPYARAGHRLGPDAGSRGAKG